MNDNAFGIREGEIAVELPKDYDASLYFIGHIRTPWRRREDCPKNARESDAVCTLEVDPRWAQALTDVESCSHLVVLYWMNRSRRDLVLQVPRTYGIGRGTFALRSPARPNPIAMSVAESSTIFHLLWWLFLIVALPRATGLSRGWAVASATAVWTLTLLLAVVRGNALA